MVVPSFFAEHFECLDDYSSGAVFAGLIRLLKYLAFLLAVFGPGLYVMAVSFAPELIPVHLLAKLAQGEASTPLPPMPEMLAVTLLLEIVREAGLRAPKSISHTVSLVGALIIGETAVSAGIISVPVLTMAAAATIAVVLCVVSALSSGTGLLHNALGVIASPFRAAGSAVAGAAFIVPVKGIEQVVTVAVIVAVTFASWPVYSCWMPSLTAFTLLSLTPLTISVAAQYGVSQTAMALVIIAVTVFILYSGRKLNEMVLSSILTDAENRRLVERLKTEINRAESARRATEAVSEQRARFFAAANHDLRQPLQAMGICLDILKRRSTPETAPIIAHLTSTSNSISPLVSVSLMYFAEQPISTDCLRNMSLYSCSTVSPMSKKSVSSVSAQDTSKLPSQ